MKLDTARQHLRLCRERMHSLYSKPVFDEWAVIGITQGRASVLDYEGPRKDSFTKTLAIDSAQLCEVMKGKHYETGDFEFVQDAQGLSFDAVVRLGDGTYLLCNNTEGSMAELRADPRWREAQKPFVALCEKFLADALE